MVQVQQAINDAGVGSDRQRLTQVLNKLQKLHDARKNEATLLNSGSLTSLVTAARSLKSDGHLEVASFELKTMNKADLAQLVVEKTEGVSFDEVRQLVERNQQQLYGLGLYGYPV